MHHRESESRLGGGVRFGLGWFRFLGTEVSTFQTHPERVLVRPFHPVFHVWSRILEHLCEKQYTGRTTNQRHFAHAQIPAGGKEAQNAQNKKSKLSEAELHSWCEGGLRVTASDEPPAPSEQPTRGVLFEYQPLGFARPTVLQSFPLAS